MHLFTGSPLSLKKQFLLTLQELKNNPLERVLVLIPSKHLETRLKKELCKELSCLAGVNFMPLSALAREINQAAKNPPPPLLEDSPLLDFKIKHLLDKHGFKANRNLAICFKNSFRDLINAEVTPQTLALIQDDEDLVLDEQKQYLQKFIPLYTDFLEIQKEKNKSTYKEFFTAAKENTANNAFLNSFKQIIFYGFYDVTSLHFELIKEIINSYKDKTQMFLPYEKQPAYTFVEPSFNSLFLPLSTKHTELKSEKNFIKIAAENIFTPEQKRAYDADIKIIKVSGEGEVLAAAKQILELHKNGIAYEDIALTFRGEGGFNNKILDIFPKNQIPINYNFSFPLLQKPFAAFIYNLFNLTKSNFSKAETAAVLNAPYFAFKQETLINLIQQSGAECSINQFEEMIPNSPDKTTLINILKGIKADILMLEQAGSFADLAQKAKVFLSKYTSEKAKNEQAETLKQIIDILNVLGTYSTTGQTAREGEFLEEFFTLLKEAVFNKVIYAPNAVEVADIMTLRLQDFKAVIILGLNEGILPLVPGQDPALKEVYRQSLRKPIRRALQNIGYLIHTRQNRYFEENFLFYLALSAAQEKAILTYKTSDEEGKHAVKSIFITLLLTVLGKKEEDLQNISRRPFERLKNDIKPLFLNKEEAANLLALNEMDSKEIFAALLVKSEEEKAYFEQDYLALKALSSQGNLTAFDGIISQNSAKKMHPAYFSPTALSNLYSCPAKYFFSRLTKNEQEISLRGELAYNKIGTLYHEILCKFYASVKNKLPDMTDVEIENLSTQFIDKYFKEYDHKKYGLYPLLWESIKQDIKEILLNFINKDFKNMQKKQFFPYLMEVDATTNLQLKQGPFTVKATIDRIDKNPDSTENIAVDYKRSGKSMEIKNLIFHDNKLQPPLYLEILNSPAYSVPCTAASFFFIEADSAALSSKTLSLSEFKTIDNNFTSLLNLLQELALQGIFPITPDEKTSCEFCQFKDICRKYHTQTLKRAKKSIYFKQLRKTHYAFKG